MTPQEEKEEIICAARKEGLVVGVAPLPADLKSEYFRKWIADGQHGNMGWMDIFKRIIPRAVMSKCQSVVVVGFNYYLGPQGPGDLDPRGHNYTCTQS